MHLRRTGDTDTQHCDSRETLGETQRDGKIMQVRQGRNARETERRLTKISPNFVVGSGGRAVVWRAMESQDARPKRAHTKGGDPRGASLPREIYAWFGSQRL